MLKHVKKILLAVSLVVVGSVAIDHHQQHTCFPENDLYISSNLKSRTLMSEAIFNKVIDEVELIYAPIVKAKGGELQIERKWEDGTVNAYAQRVGKVYKVSMFGGLARHNTVTPDGFALVVCHEIGHHIGGAPKKKSWWGASWASNEGQADYFGSTKCMKRVLDVMDEFHENDEEADEFKFAKKECEKRYQSQQDIYVCSRSAMAGKSLANLFKALRKLPKELKFADRDPKVVSTTNHNHPAPQCRLDTYFAGSLCNKTVDQELSDTDEKEGACLREDDLLAARSQCWYKRTASKE